jgi:hypothetical protein
MSREAEEEEADCQRGLRAWATFRRHSTTRPSSGYSYRCRQRGTVGDVGAGAACMWPCGFGGNAPMVAGYECRRIRPTGGGGSIEVEVGCDIFGRDSESREGCGKKGRRRLSLYLTRCVCASDGSEVVPRTRERVDANNRLRDERSPMTQIVIS